jgi:transcriptional regulator with XRE-family HTH domain
MSLIRHRISERGLTQAEFARRLSVSSQAVSDWIRRTRIPRPRQMKKLAAELEVPLEKLLADFYR